VVGIADALGIATVAEGIENEQALDCMARLGCRYAQGFHIARPLAPAALLRWLAADGQAR
jgi:EAL domain-containing protein (putative c-di-GMP-specific phosphodiesterase class I)